MRLGVSLHLKAFQACFHHVLLQAAHGFPATRHLIKPSTCVLFGKLTIPARRFFHAVVSGYPCCVAAGLHWDAGKGSDSRWPSMTSARHIPIAAMIHDDRER